jgi:hypothetical protein
MSLILHSTEEASRMISKESVPQSRFVRAVVVGAMLCVQLALVVVLVVMVDRARRPPAGRSLELIPEVMGLYKAITVVFVVVVVGSLFWRRRG